jgi:NAD(P)-dependent dehydrogenase (short-subunit alcohol dehydrogenase family)
LLARGLRVVMTGRDANAIERAAGETGGDPARVIALRLDVNDPASIEAVHRAVARQFGGVDVLVNNAAVLLFDDSDVLAIPGDAYRQTFETNLFGVIEMCRVFVPPMADRGYGRVVNVSSGAGQISSLSTYAPAYSLSKVALNAFTRILAETYRSRGVLANVVDPGWVRTDMGGPAAPRSVQQGVATTVWLAMLPDDGPSGGFFRDKRTIEW